MNDYPYLYLDDYRDPPESHTVYDKELTPGGILLANPREGDARYLEQKWGVVRSYHSFVDAVVKRHVSGLPMYDLISFDHDLCQEHYKYLSNPIPYEKFSTPTGYHAAVWLKEFCATNKVTLPEIVCHSMNPAGCENILKLFKEG